MKKLLALLCAAAISLSCVPVLAEDAGTTWVDPSPVAAFIDELDVTGSSQAEKRADFLNPESATYVSQRDAMSGNAYEFYDGTELGSTLRRPHGYQTEATYIRYRVNPGWKLAVKTMDCSGTFDIEIKFRGTHYKTEYRELASTKVVSPTKITEGTNSYEIATHYCDIPADVYWVEVHLPMGNGQWHPNYKAGGTWAAGIMSVSMWNSEFIDELDDASANFLTSKTATYMPQRYDYSKAVNGYNVIEKSNFKGTIGNAYHRGSQYRGNPSYITYAATGGYVAEVKYLANSSIKTGLDCVRIFASSDGATFTQITETENPASYAAESGYSLYREYALLPEGTTLLKVMLPADTSYTHYHIGIMSVEVRNPNFYDDIEGSFSTTAGTDGYIIQRAGMTTSNGIITFVQNKEEIGGTLCHRNGWKGNTGFVAYKAYPGKQVVFDTYNIGTTYRLSIYTTAEYTTDFVNKGTLLTNNPENIGKLDNDTVQNWANNEVYTGVIPEGHYYVYALFPAMNEDSHNWHYGLRNVTMRDVPAAPVVEYEHTNPGEMAKIDAVTGKLTTSGLVVKNAGEAEKVTVYLASYNGNSLVDIDCHIDNEVAVGEYVQYALEVEPAATYRLFIWKGEIEPIAVYDFDLQ